MLVVIFVIEQAQRSALRTVHQRKQHTPTQNLDKTSAVCSSYSSVSKSAITRNGTRSIEVPTGVERFEDFCDSYPVQYF